MVTYYIVKILAFFLIGLDFWDFLVTLLGVGGAEGASACSVGDFAVGCVSIFSIGLSSTFESIRLS